MYRVSFYGVDPNYLRNFHNFNESNDYQYKDIIPMTAEENGKKIDYIIKGLKIYRVADGLLVNRYRSAKLLDDFLMSLGAINKSLFGRRLVIKRVF